MPEFNEFVPRVHFELIPIKDLVSNQDYQRNLSDSHIIRASEEFDVYQINPVKVSRRNGINYVFNGQHTIEIVAMVSGSRETPVWCMIYDDLSYEHEADIFANQMKHVKPLQPYEIFKANIEAGNPDQLMIRDIVQSYGLTIGNKKVPGMVAAVSSLESIYKKYGYHALSRVLRLCVGAWEGDPSSLTANMLNGVARLVVTYGDKLKDEEFKEKVGAISARQIGRQAKERCPGSMGYAETMVMAYNGKKKSLQGRLSMSKLHSTTIEKNNEDLIEENICEEEPNFDEFDESPVTENPELSFFESIDEV